MKHKQMMKFNIPVISNIKKSALESKEKNWQYLHNHVTYMESWIWKLIDSIEWILHSK